MQLGNHTFLIVIVIVVLLLIIVWFLLNRFKRASSSGRTANNQQIYIGNLPYRIAEEELEDEFSQYGRVQEVRIVKDRRSGRSKGYAFVTFASARDAKKSLDAHGHVLMGRSLVVHIAKPR